MEDLTSRTELFQNISFIASETKTPHKVLIKFEKNFNSLSDSVYTDSCNEHFETFLIKGEDDSEKGDIDGPFLSILDSPRRFLRKDQDSPSHLDRVNKQNSLTDNEFSIYASHPWFDDAIETNNDPLAVQNDNKQSDREFVHYSRTSKNINNKSEDKSFSCKICGKLFHDIESLRFHMKVQRDDLGIECKLCDRIVHSSNYENHRLIHSLYSKPSSYETKILSNITNQSLSCKICKKSFLTKKDLERHLKPKIGDFRIPCHFCDQVFHAYDYVLHHTEHLDEKKYSCSICDKRFKTLASVQFHERTHMVEQPFCCEFCNKTFSERLVLKSHRSTHIGSKFYFCDICNKKYSNMTLLNQHKMCHSKDKIKNCDKLFKNFKSCRRVHVGTKLFKCNCGRQYPRSESLKLHQKNSNCLASAKLRIKKETEYSIESENVPFNFKNNLINDSPMSIAKCDAMEAGTHPKPSDTKISKKPALYYVCNYCNKSYNSFVDLRMHILTHKESRLSNSETMSKTFCFLNKVLSCDICHKKFLHNSSLETHMNTHTGHEFHCEVCDKVYSKSTHLKRHRMLHAGLKPFSCNVCQKAFATSRNLVTHIAGHSNDRKILICEICGKSFQTPTGLRVHRANHLGIKPHKCNVCQKAFVHVRNLQEHSIVHSNVKSFSCEDCGRAFKTRRTLLQHKLIHSDERPLSCNICGSRFKHLTSLIGHKAIHTGLKPFSCDVCGMAFALSNRLKVHKLVHSDIKPYKCGLCEKSFIQRYKLRQHERNHKNVYF